VMTMNDLRMIAPSRCWARTQRENEPSIPAAYGVDSAFALQNDS
jgi:hypothetical protein